jgi:hypothetical protein
MMAPRRFGDRLEVHASGTIDLRPAMAERDARLSLRPARDQLDIEDAQVLEYKDVFGLAPSGDTPENKDADGQRPSTDGADSDPRKP